METVQRRETVMLAMNITSAGRKSWKW